jgi:hypothetical protein
LYQPCVVSFKAGAVGVPSEPFKGHKLKHRVDSMVTPKVFQRNLVPNARSGVCPLRNWMLAELGYHVGHS